MAEILTVAVKTAFSLGLSRLLKMLRANDVAVREAIEEQTQEVLFEMQEAIRQQGAQADESLTLKEALALVRPLYDEALRSPASERIRMLAHAMAGLFKPNYELEMKSRVSRAVGQLEPSDVHLLRDIRGTNDPGREKIYKERKGVAFAPLVQSACVFVDWSGYGGYSKIEVTPTGQAVLDVLAGWQSTA